MSCELTSVEARAQALLNASRESAEAAGLARDRCAHGNEAVKAQQWVPFDQQTPVGEYEQIFEVRAGVYWGSEFGARNPELFQIFRIGAVMNITAGERMVPNVFEDAGVEYINYQLTDQPGEDILSRGIREGVVEIDKLHGKGTPVFIHCSAGLSRSASVALAWLMKYERLTLSEAVHDLTRRRGRRLQINPSFWMALATWEREIQGHVAGTPPSFDFTPWWIEDFQRMGFSSEEKIRRALVQYGDWVSFEAAFEHLLSDQG
eukprot:TRINITY_DN65358_c0_g1_i1.p1 TRINITY_DN65358_c0_g1~~TRINITY_DN65358_c0_g1_i1.p1  ORF type:complete len:262 (-),score=29.10 TRINITY_DN65358_c0_g1_i1:44-829(-)